MSSSLPRIGRLVPLACALGLAACEFPSEPPIFEQTWMVPAASSTIGVKSLLPTGVDTAGGATSFVVTTPSTTINSTLAAICGNAACQNATPATVPTPAFTSPVGALSTTITFPAGVNAATVSGGSLQLQITNNLGFDPLRPNGVSTAPFGSIVIGMTSGGTTSSTTINGSASQGLPNGQVTTLTIALPTGAYTGSVSVTASITAPAGPAATIRSTNTFAVGASLVGFAISGATVVVNAKAISTTPSDFDLSEVDFGGDIQGGGLVLELVNPLTVTAIINFTFNAPPQGGNPAVNVVKLVNIASNTTSIANLTLNAAEMSSLAGKTGVTVAMSGTATGTGAGNTVAVTPAALIAVRTKVSLTVRVGG